MDSQTQKNLLNIVKRNYEEIAEEFADTRNRKNRSWDELVKLCKTVKKDDKVLDVGCGNGRLLEALKKHRYSGTGKEINYIGVDSSAKLVSIAKSRFPDVKFLVGDILELGKIPDINFDYVFCLAVLHHLPGRNLQIQALKQLKNKVADNGQIIISVWNLWSKHWQRNFRWLIFKFFLLKLIKKNNMDFGDILFTGFNKKSQRYYHAFRKRGLRKIIKKSGLKIKKLYKDQYNYYIILQK